jgi:uncharacterized protein (DUF1684 family)
MKKILAITVFLIGGLNTFCQIDSALYRAESIRFWEEQNAHYRDKKESPLDKKARKIFAGHRVYAYDANFVIAAKMVRYEREDTVVMKTSADTEKLFVKYAQLHFNLGRSHCHLTVYQSLTGRLKEEHKNDLFIPFKDLTSGKDTYGGGRYLDVQIPEGNTLILNFNTAYNPYCAYTDGYFCPIPPAENMLNVEVKAGAMAPVVGE